MKHITANNLRYKIKLLKSEVRIDELGGRVKYWEKYKEIWASFEPYVNLLYKIGNYENINFTAENIVFFHIRYLESIDIEMRIIYEQKLFQIIRIINLKKQSIHISAKEIINE